MSEQTTIPQHELQALVELLNRTPLSLPERLWVNSFVTRLAATEPEEEAEPEDPNEPEEEEETP